MPMKRVLETLVTGVDRGPVVVYECRRCGTSLDARADDCPYCGPTSVARYEIRR